MHPLPNTFDPKSLKGERLLMICFNANQITFHFESSTRITFEGEYIIEKNNQPEKFNVFPLKGDNGLLELIETEIVDSYTDYERKDLRIKFSNAIMLTLIGSDQYMNRIQLKWETLKSWYDDSIRDILKQRVLPT